MEKARGTVRIEMHGHVCRRGRLENPVAHSTLRDVATPRNGVEVSDAMLTRKASTGRGQVTVLKQTHVGEESILRCSSETS